MAIVSGELRRKTVVNSPQADNVGDNHGPKAYTDIPLQNHADFEETECVGDEEEDDGDEQLGEEEEEGRGALDEDPFVNDDHADGCKHVEKNRRGLKTDEESVSKEYRALEQRAERRGRRYEQRAILKVASQLAPLFCRKETGERE